MTGRNAGQQDAPIATSNSESQALRKGEVAPVSRLVGLPLRCLEIKLDGSCPNATDDKYNTVIAPPLQDYTTDSSPVNETGETTEEDTDYDDSDSMEGLNTEKISLFNLVNKLGMILRDWSAMSFRLAKFLLWTQLFFQRLHRHRHRRHQRAILQITIHQKS